jgi:O-antigen ligase
MISNVKEMRLASMLAWGSLLITLVITDRISSEPANLGKMLILSCLGFGAIPLFVSSLRGNFRDYKVMFISLAIFLISAFISIFTSENPIERGFFGAFGRNTGFLSYFLLSVLFLAAISFKSFESLKKVRIGLFVAGSINVVVCLLAISGNEVFAWDNPSKSIMGTFGNSNFIGAFLGIFSALVFVYLASNLGDIKAILGSVALLAVTLYVIDRTNALQGLVMFLLMGFLTLYFALRSRTKFLLISKAYLVSGVTVGLVGLLGVLNKGPLAEFLYKPSVTFRGEYWMAGINMGLERPLFGVGIDSYGTYYRTYRDESAVAFPGVDVTTDAAHNVFIDIFAGTGFIGLISYVLLAVLVLKQAITYLQSNKQFDPLFLSLFLPWLGYQIQSIVSINQLGLAVWGWLLGGAVVAYTRIKIGDISNQATNSNNVSAKLKGKKVSQQSQLLPAGTALSVFSMLVVGVLIALPPFMADAKMRTIMSGKGDSADLIAHVKSFPVDTIRLNRGVVALANSGFNVLAAEVAMYGTTRFPNDYASWFSLYELSGPGTPDSEVYREKLNQIDPFNPKYFVK